MACFICTDLINPCNFGDDLRVVDNLKICLPVTCKLLKIEGISENEWNKEDTHCCSKCLDMVLKIKNTHDTLMEAQMQLRTCLKQLEIIVKNSAKDDKKDYSWGSNCKKFRHDLIYRRNKDPLSDETSSRIDFEFDTSWQDYTSDFDWQEEWEKDRIGQNDLTDCYQKPRSKSRRVVVIAEEDDQFPRSSHNIDYRVEDDTGSLYDGDADMSEDSSDDEEYKPRRSGRKRSSGEAKFPTSKERNTPKVSTEGMIITTFESKDGSTLYKTKCTSCYRTLKSKSRKGLRNGLRKHLRTKACAKGPEGTPPPESDPLPTDKYKAPTTFDVPFRMITEHIYLYRTSTFVEYTYTHLVCRATNCSFQIPFDYYPSFQALRAHIEEHHQNTLVAIECLVCNTTFPRLYKFREHFNSTHKQFKPKVTKAVCECCLRPVYYPGALRHMFSHKNFNEAETAKLLGQVPSDAFEANMKCTHEGCPYTFKRKKDFDSHLVTHLPREQRPDAFVCQECGVTILGKTNLDIHIKQLHRPDLIKPEDILVCTDCGKRYMRLHKRKFEAHLRMHRGEKPFMCQVCGNRFYDKSKLRVHIKHVHDEGEYSCVQCGKMYTKLNSLKCHWHIHHKELPFPGGKGKSTRIQDANKFYNHPQQRKWTCENCGLVFERERFLEKHRAAGCIVKYE